jgi:nucleoside-diphosphate-sugar epimerase
VKLAFLGASSQIAKDLAVSVSQNSNYKLILFGRDFESLKNWAISAGLNSKVKVHNYSDFDIFKNYDIIINFVGIGSPEKMNNMGDNILKITEKYDFMALDYIKSNPETKYIFLSSGAVFGGEYREPVNEHSVSSININSTDSRDFYAIAKLQAEKRHRKLFNLSIVDIRVFNYFSHTQDMGARFLMTDIVRSIKSGEVLKTSSDNIVRDIISPPDFYNFIQAIINFKPINIVLDCYTKEPIAKFDLLIELMSKFGLKYQVDQSVDIVNISGLKINYYSKNKSAHRLGYKPNKSSLDAIISECILFLNSE